jgi:hypothetical protein
MNCSISLMRRIKGQESMNISLSKIVGPLKIGRTGVEPGQQSAHAVADNVGQRFADGILRCPPCISSR